MAHMMKPIYDEAAQEYVSKQLLEERELNQMTVDALKTTVRQLVANNDDLHKQLIRWEIRVMELEDRCKLMRLVADGTVTAQIKEPAQSED